MGTWVLPPVVVLSLNCEHHCKGEKKKEKKNMQNQYQYQNRIECFWMLE